MPVILVKENKQTVYLKQYFLDTTKTPWKWVKYSNSRIPYELEDTRFRRAVARVRDNVLLFADKSIPGKDKPIAIAESLIQECCDELEINPFKPGIRFGSISQFSKQQPEKQLKPTTIDKLTNNLKQQCDKIPERFRKYL